MLRKIMLAVAAVAFVSTPSFAAVQNVKVSGNIDSSYIVRDRFDLDRKSTRLNSSHLKLSRMPSSA